jgi:hypothetical protein
MNLEPSQCEKTAQNLMYHAASLASAHETIRELCHTAPDVIRAEMDALDAMDDHAEALIKSMRAIAMRLDRAALVKFNPEGGAA